MEFNIGDRVVCNGEVDGRYSTRGEHGIVIGDIDPSILIQFDRPIPDAHNGAGQGRDGCCLWVSPDMLIKLETSAGSIIPAAEREYITL